MFFNITYHPFRDTVTLTATYIFTMGSIQDDVKAESQPVRPISSPENPLPPQISTMAANQDQDQIQSQPSRPSFYTLSLICNSIGTDISSQRSLA
jgi:hypothetical protein